MEISLPPELPVLKPRPADSHKGTFGTAFLVGGSVGMTGAIVLAGKAALRGGAGLVRVAVPRSCVTVVATAEPSYLTLPLPEDRAGRLGLEARRIIAQQWENATALAIGPGLGRSDGLEALVWWIYEECPRPLVVDADGLNALASRKALLGRLPTPQAPRIITPHPGEFDRLVGRGKLSPEQRAAVQAELALAFRAVLVLKGHRTRVTDGQSLYINPTGNPGMATGGSGDVLTGLITALVCQGLSPFEAAALGVYLHGLAGDLAAQDLGQESLIASDLIDYLPRAFLAYRSALKIQNR